MKRGLQLPRCVMTAGLAAGAALCVIGGIAWWKVAGSAPPRRPNTVAAFLDPPRVDFWERVNLLFLRGRGASGRRLIRAVLGR